MRFTGLKAHRTSPPHSNLSLDKKKCKINNFVGIFFLSFFKDPALFTGQYHLSIFPRSVLRNLLFWCPNLGPPTFTEYRRYITSVFESLQWQALPFSSLRRRCSSNLISLQPQNRLLPQGPEHTYRHSSTRPDEYAEKQSESDRPLLLLQATCLIRLWNHLLGGRDMVVLGTLTMTSLPHATSSSKEVIRAQCKFAGYSSNRHSILTRPQGEYVFREFDLRDPRQAFDFLF